MPRYIFSSDPPSSQHDKLVKKLAQELTTPGSHLQPLILERRIPSTQSRHVHVIWDLWKDLSDDQRAAVILDAYTQAEGEGATAQVTIAEGVTSQEALALGLLPFLVTPGRTTTDEVAPEDSRRAIAEEARNSILGAKARQLRYARLEDAEQAVRRLELALPGSSWVVVQESTQES